MKKILTIAVLAIGMFASAQIEVKQKEEKVIVGTYKNLSTTMVELSYIKKEDKNLCFLTYLNLKYQHISDYQVVGFYATETELKGLYDIFNNVLNSTEKEIEQTITLGNENVTIKKSKMLGKKYLTIFSDNGWFYLDQKQLNKVFAIQ